MKIELVMDGELKTFRTDFVPMLANRKHFEVMARIEEERGKEVATREILELDDDYYAILSDIVFKKQFTLEEMYAGASINYIANKMAEAMSGRSNDESEETDGETGK